MSETLRFDLLANDRASSVFDKVGKAAGDTESTFGKVGKSLLSVGKVAAVGLAGGVTAGALALGKMVGEARESERVGKLTESIIKSTGGAANLTAAQVGALSTSISNKTGVDDEAIQSGSNLLLTFKNVRNEVGAGNKVFDQATAAAVDLSAAGFGSIEGASKMLGKALNDPIAGISALGRAGVTFTAQQKEQIAAMVEAGNVLGAQKMILGEVQSQVGGAAAATSTAMDKAKVAVGNLGESVGTLLLPYIDKLAGFLSSQVVPALSGFITGMQTGEGVGGRFADVIGRVRDFLSGVVVPKIAGFITEMQNGTGAGGSFADALGKMRDAAQGAWKVIEPLLSFLADNKTAVATFAGVILTVVAAIRVWTAVQAALNLVMMANPFGLIVVAIAALAAGLVIAYKRSETFRDIVDGAMTAAGKIFRSFWNDFAQPVLRFLVEGLADMAGAFATLVDGMSHIPGFGWLKPLAEGMHKAADQGHALANSINDIPDRTVHVNVVVNTSAIAKAQHQLDAAGFVSRMAADAGRGGEGVRKFSFNLGSLFADGFKGGIKAKTKAALAAVHELVQRSLDKLNDLKTQAKQITDSVASAMKGALDVGSLGAVGEDGVAANPAAQLANFAAQAGQFSRALGDAAAHGVNADLIGMVAQLGPQQGLIAAQALAAMDQASVASANASLAAVDRFAGQLGQTVLTTTSLPEDIAREQAKLDTLKAIQTDLQNNPRNITFVVNDATDPDRVVAAIRRWLRRNGKHVGDLD